MTLRGPLLAFALVALIASARAGEVPLLQNGGFEDGAGGWSVVDLAGATRVAVDSKTKADGRQSLRIEREAPSGRGFVKQYVDLPSTKKPLRLRLRYRVDKRSDLSAALYFSDAEGAALGGAVPLFQSGKTKSFESVDESVDVPEGAARVGLDLSIGSGTAWVDDVELLCEVPDGLPDPGLEDGGEGWVRDDGDGVLVVASDTKRRTQGKASLRLERSGPRLRPETGVVGTARGVASKAKRASVAVAVAAVGGARPVVVVQAFDGSGRCLGTERVEVAPSKDFADATAALGLPAGTTSVRVALLVSGIGTAWFDDVRLELK